MIITGHLARDCDLRYSGKGTGVCNFSVAVKRDYGDEVDFFNVVAFDRGKYKLAEWTANNIGKGKLVTVIGKGIIEEWEKNGQKQS
jgi:single-strand DNA-binding protein